MRSHVEGAHDLAAGGVEGVEPGAGPEPDPAAVEGHAMHRVDAREWAIFAKDFGPERFHASVSMFVMTGPILSFRQRIGE